MQDFHPETTLQTQMALSFYTKYPAFLPLPVIYLRQRSFFFVCTFIAFCFPAIDTAILPTIFRIYVYSHLVFISLRSNALPSLPLLKCIQHYTQIYNVLTATSSKPDLQQHPTGCCILFFMSMMPSKQKKPTQKGVGLFLYYYTL